MIRFEIKKIFSKTANKIGLIVLLAAIAVTCYFAISSMAYVMRKGDTHTGNCGSEGTCVIQKRNGKA